MSEANYIRGAGAARIDSRRVGRVLAVLAVAGLAATAVLLTVLTASHNSTASRLRRDGVPVVATVSRCTGISSGIGMAVEYYACEGSYVLDGSRYEATIRGSRASLPVGTPVAAVVLAGRPSSLTLAKSVPASTSTGAYVAPIVLGALSVGGAAGLAGWTGRRRGRRRGRIRGRLRGRRRAGSGSAHRGRGGGEGESVGPADHL